MKPSTATGGKHPVFLVVDDDQDNLILMSYQLAELLPCSVISASDGNTALEIARQNCPDLILLDIMLPDMDGMQVVRGLREDPSTQAIPVIAVTAMARPQDQTMALQAGFDDYVSKPYSLENLAAVIHPYLQQPTLSA